jgi:nicotinamidase-related amidase
MIPIPKTFDPAMAEKIVRVPYQDIAMAAIAWRQRYDLPPVAAAARGTVLLLIDVQNTFCLPEFELFVGGRSGRGAIDDSIRICEFIYRHIGEIDAIVPTLDTHTALQIFHPIFWIDDQGNHPIPAATIIELNDVKSGKWRVNPAMAASNNLSPEALQVYALHYVERLDKLGKYPLTVWPYHAMLGGIGHALVPSVEAAIFFHSIARQTQPQFELKGSVSLTENYSVFQPEVTTDVAGNTIATTNNASLDRLLEYERIFIAGQAKSHCVAWTVADLLTAIQKRDPALAKKVYLLEDCMSPVVVPNVVDYTNNTEAIFADFARAGMNIVGVG